MTVGSSDNMYNSGRVAGIGREDQSTANGWASDYTPGWIFYETMEPDEIPEETDMDAGGNWKPSAEMYINSVLIKDVFLPPLSSRIERSQRPRRTVTVAMMEGNTTSRSPASWLTVKEFTRPVHDKISRGKIYLNDHQAMHTGAKRYRGHQCPKSFRQKSYLKDHQAAHIGYKFYKCRHCPKYFLSTTALLSHSKSKHAARERYYKCRLCPRSYKYENHLIRHNKKH